MAKLTQEFQDSTQLVNALGLHPQSAKAIALNSLSQQEFDELVACYSFDDDDLIHVDSDGFKINHGCVGSQGILYDFRR